MDILVELGRGVILPITGSKDLQVQFSQLYEAERFSAYLLSESNGESTFKSEAFFKCYYSLFILLGDI